MKNISRKKSKIKVKNTLPHLLEAVFAHEDCPEWLKSEIFNTLADTSNIPADTAENFAERLKHTTLPQDAKSISLEVVQ